MVDDRQNEVKPTGDSDSGKESSRVRILRERFFFFALVLILCVLVLILIWPFITTILLGVAMVIIVKPLYGWYLGRGWIRERSSWATGFTIVTTLLLIVLPLILLLSVAVHQGTAFFADLDSGDGTITLERLIAGVTDFVNEAQADEGVHIDAETLREQLQTAVGALATGIVELIGVLGDTLSRFIIEAIIVLAIMMVMLPTYEHPDEGTFEALVPFPPEITRLYIGKIKLMITAMFKGTFFIAFIEGALMGLVYWIAGVPNAIFLGLISMLLSVLPVIGVSLLAWPIAIVLILMGDVWQGLFIIAMVILVVGNVDSVLRPMLVPEDAYLNPALTLLSVFGGIILMGLVGLLYGPVIMILLVTSVDVYTKYILRSDLEPYLDEDGSLDLEKLGLQRSESANDETGGGVMSVVNKYVGRLTNRSAGTDKSQTDQVSV